MRSVYTEMFQLALYTIVSRNEILFSEISAVKFNSSVMTICFFEKVCYQLFSSDIPKREDVV